jgi:hypothetical protein
MPVATPAPCSRPSVALAERSNMTGREYVEARRSEIESHGRSLTLFTEWPFTIAIIKEYDLPTDISENTQFVNALFKIMKK